MSTKKRDRVYPTFVLESLLPKDVSRQILPQAKALIAQRERVGQPIYDSSEIQKLASRKPPKPRITVLGCGYMAGCGPRTDFFTVLVRGLTNAQKVNHGRGQVGIPAKLLLLRFSRPGVTINETEDIIRFGVLRWRIHRDKSTFWTSTASRNALIMSGFIGKLCALAGQLNIAGNSHGT